MDVSEDSIAYLRESKRESVLVFVSRKGVRKTLDICKYGYKVDETLFGPELKGSKLKFSSKDAIAGIWRLK